MGRLQRGKSIALNQAFSGRYLRKIYLSDESKVLNFDNREERTPFFGLYRIRSFEVDEEVLYVKRAILISEVKFS